MIIFKRKKRPFAAGLPAPDAELPLERANSATGPASGEPGGASYPAGQMPRLEPHIQDPALRRQQAREDLSRLLHSPHGLRYLGRLVAMSGALGASYAPACSHATAYNEGLRRMGLLILAEAEEAAPEALPGLLTQGLPVPPKTPLQ